MSEPASGGAAKAAAEMLKELQDAMQQADKLDKAQQVDPAKFENTLQTQQAGQVQQVHQTNEIRPTQGTTDVIRAATTSNRAPAVPAVGQAIDTGKLKNGLQRIVTDIMSGQKKYGKVLELAMSGRNFSHSELLALQAGVYRFSQELELTSKVVEKGTSAIKQTLNTQV